MANNSASDTNLGIDGFVVSKVSVDVSLHLYLANDPEEDVNRAEITIECPLRVRSSNADDAVEIDAQDADRAVLGPVLAAYGRFVEQGTVAVDGTLTLRLNGLCITVPPCPYYEAWDVNVEFGRWLIATPGGGFSVMGDSSGARVSGKRLWP